MDKMALSTARRQEVVDRPNFKPPLGFERKGDAAAVG
jgi:hypothetical protein